MIHKSLSDSHMNLINYMACPLTNHKFIGFIELECDQYWGIKSGDKSFAACHLFETDSKNIRSDSSKLEQKLIDKGLTTVLYLKGNDNTSYLIRFRSAESAIKWFYKTEKFRPDNESCWVNS